MKLPGFFRITVAASLALVAATSLIPQPASADDATTAAIAAGVGAIVGGLLYDANNRPYYERGGRRVYVNERVARDYRDRGGRYRDSHGHWHGHDHH
jgi:hypothetical protein